MAAYISFQPSDFFNTVLYSAGTAPLAITGVGFQPDMTWIKSRTYTDNQNLFDSVRGATEIIYPNDVWVEDTQAESLKSWQSDGFTVGTRNDTNRSGQTFASWNWKAGTTTGIDTTGSTITPLGYSFNATCGFSVVEYTGNDTSGATVPHGLGVAPAMVIVKCLGSANSFVVQHQSLGPTKYLYLNTSGAVATATNRWNDTAPTAVNVVLGNTGNTNGSGSDSPIIMYSFAEKKGYSKFGSYTGNGNADGPFVYTGFRPSMVIVKGNTAEAWRQWDDKREGYNSTNDSLSPNNTWVEAYGGTPQGIDILSNGFKLTSSNSEVNLSGTTYIYMAFAKFPLVSSNSKAGTAR